MPPPPRLRLNKSRLLLCPSSNNKTHSSARMTGADCYVPAPGVHPISASSLTGLGFPTVTNTTNVDFGSKDDADGRDAPPTVGSKVAYAPASQSIHLREQHTCRGGITPTANGSLPSLNPFSWDCVPARHASLIGDEVPHPSCALGMSMPLDAFPGDAEYYSVSLSFSLIRCNRLLADLGSLMNSVYCRPLLTSRLSSHLLPLLQLVLSVHPST